MNIELIVRLQNNALAAIDEIVTGKANDTVESQQLRANVAFSVIQNLGLAAPSLLPEVPDMDAAEDEGPDAEVIPLHEEPEEITPEEIAQLATVTPEPPSGVQLDPHGAPPLG